MIQFVTSDDNIQIPPALSILYHLLNRILKYSCRDSSLWHSIIIFISVFPFFSLFLTSRTIHTTPPADNSTTQCISAGRASFVGVTIHLQKWSIAVVLTFCYQVILLRDTIFINEVTQAVGNLTGKTFPFINAQTVCGGSGIYLCTI